MEYMDKYVLAAGSTTIPCPSVPITGVYASAAVSIVWDYNGTVGPIATNVTMWEPTVPFKPGRTSALIVTATQATELTVRVLRE